jgi:hypothetical protein
VKNPEVNKEKEYSMKCVFALILCAGVFAGDPPQIQYKWSGEVTEIVGVATINTPRWRCKWVYFDAATKMYSWETTDGVFFKNQPQSEIRNVSGRILNSMPKEDRNAVVLHCKDGRCTVQK